MQIVDDVKNLPGFSRSVTVSKQALELAAKMNQSANFVSVFRFLNLVTVRNRNLSFLLIQFTYAIISLYCNFLGCFEFFQGDMNCTVLNDEVLAVEVGYPVTNLTDKIAVNFRKLSYVSKKKNLRKGQ